MNIFPCTCAAVRTHLYTHTPGRRQTSSFCCPRGCWSHAQTQHTTVRPHLTQPPSAYAYKGARIESRHDPRHVTWTAGPPAATRRPRRKTGWIASRARLADARARAPGCPGLPAGQPSARTPLLGAVSGRARPRDAWKISKKACISKRQQQSFSLRVGTALKIL